MAIPDLPNDETEDKFEEICKEVLDLLENKGYTGKDTLPIPLIKKVFDSTLEAFKKQRAVTSLAHKYLYTRDEAFMMAFIMKLFMPPECIDMSNPNAAQEWFDEMFPPDKP